MIVKVQRAIIGNTMLIYNKDNSITYEGELRPELRKLIGENYKGYFEAEVNERGQIVLGKKVREQNW